MKGHRKAGFLLLAAAGLVAVLSGCKAITNLLGVVPATPQGLSVSSPSESSLTVSWIEVWNASGYRVFRALGQDGPYDSKVYDGPALAFTDSGLAAGTMYSYTIQSLNGNGQGSPLSAPASGTTTASSPSVTGPPTPAGLTVGNPGLTSLDVSWNASPGAQSYQVVRDTHASGAFATQVYQGPLTAFIDSGLASGETYYYKACASNTEGASPLSVPVSGTVGISDIMTFAATGSFSYSLKIALGARDVYFVFSNVDAVDAGSQPLVSGASVAGVRARALTPPPTPSPHGPALRDRPGTAGGQGLPLSTSGQPLRQQSRVLPPPPQFDTVGGTHSFMDDSVSNLIGATCRKVVSNVPVASGNPSTLNIWVADDSWCVGGTRANLVTQAMVDALADRFLKGPGTSDDIYDWVTAVYGEEYGAQSYSYLIPPDDSITILLYDIDHDNSTNGGVVGYYWAKDQYTASAAGFSNERAMFYIDSVMFATPDGGTWHPTDYWPSEIFSTLAHEFQHMIHFYQKTVLRSGGAWSETWLNEMCSMAAEDLVADKLQVDGPRGVIFSDGTSGSSENVNGRLPLYNAYNSIALTDWLAGADVLKSYSINYAFGAYLARNFGGAQLLRDVVQNDKTDSHAIEYALASAGYSDSFQTLLQKWGVANLLSDRANAPAGYQYNKNGFFTSSVGGHSYNLGSINLYNYIYGGQTGPAIWTTSPVGSGNQKKTSNLLFLAGQALSGIHEWQIQLPVNVTLNVVLK